ncbi:MAG: GT-D fold domain-containing glycosyltransferase [Muribaculaceae bacterium]
MHNTIESIIRDGKSVARYGDGELGFAAQYMSTSKYISKFQDYSDELGRRLTEIIVKGKDNDNLLVCMPAPF